MMNANTMSTRTERTTTPTGFVETGILTHAGREYASGGALVSDTHLICYPTDPTGFDGSRGGPSASGIVTNWGPERLGTYRITGHASGFPELTGRRVTLLCYRVRLDDGREYVGRGLGAGRILKCRRAATQKG